MSPPGGAITLSAVQICRYMLQLAAPGAGGFDRSTWVGAHRTSSRPGTCHEMCCVVLCRPTGPSMRQRASGMLRTDHVCCISIWSDAKYPYRRRQSHKANIRSRSALPCTVAWMSCHAVCSVRARMERAPSQACVSETCGVQHTFLPMQPQWFMESWKHCHRALSSGTGEFSQAYSCVLLQHVQRGIPHIAGIISMYTVTLC